MLGVYAIGFDPPILEYRNIPFPVTGARSIDGLVELHPGDVIPVRVERFSHAAETRTYTFSRAFVCNDRSIVNSLKSDVTSVDPGVTFRANTANSVPTMVPTDSGALVPIPPGAVCRIEGGADVDGRFFGVRSVRVAWRSADFRVVYP